MAEQKQRLGPAKKVIKWLGLGLLAFVLISALILQAPWKVTTLLAVIFLACTILPESFRKWFWLSAAAMVTALIIWVFLPEDNEGWRPYTLDDELAGLEARYAIPPEQNAATIYNRLLQDFDPREMRLAFLRPQVRKTALSGPWLSRDNPQLTQWLHSHKNVINTLLQARSIKTCRFPSNIELVLTDKSQVYRYSSLKSWAVLLLLSANNDAAESRLDRALSKYACAIQMAKHLYQQKRIIDFLIGFGIEGLTLPPLNSFVIEGQPSKNQLQLLSETLKNLKNNWCSDFSQCLEYDRLFVKNAFCSLVYQTNPKGRVRLSRNPAAAIGGRFLPRMPAQTYWQRKSMKASTILGWLFLPATPQKAAQMIDTIYEKCRPMTKPEFPWGKENTFANPSLQLNCRFLVMSLTNRSTRLYSRFHDIYLKRLALRRGSRLLTAIKQYKTEHGTWPPNLEAIKSCAPTEAFIDPVTGRQFNYETHAQRFSLYGETENIWPR